jgi:membrane-bound metal-dependent hydrolase YbcI (DUF457 family)
MPSPIGHALAGIAAGWLVAGAPNVAKVVSTSAGKVPATFLLEVGLFGALATVPDVDLLFGAHSGPTHSVGAAAVVGLAAFVSARRLGARHAGRLALACVAAYASHVLLDWLGSDSSPPIGVMALWPFSRAYYESDQHVFMAISRRYYQGWRFVRQNVLAVSLELVILVPVLALVWRFRGRRAD